MRLCKWAHVAARAIALILLSQAARGQATPAATGPGSYVAVGGGITAFQAGYGQRDLSGSVIYADVNPQWRVGLEGEARFLRWHSAEQVTESDYLGGLRLAILRPRRFQPYGKFLAGMGRIALPFGLAHGFFLAYAPGAGIDLALNDRITVRAIDFEYQHWPQFAFGPLSPYGFSAGVSVRLNPVWHFPRSR
jgi:hypothetical protein